MQIASYTSRQKGVKGWFNIAIRWRLNGPYSHNEIVFLPGDGCEDLMPDGRLEPDENGAVWCGSSTGTDKIPAHSKRRAGRMGGVRLKRIVLEDHKWARKEIYGKDPRKAAQWFRDNEGKLYAWERILGFVTWILIVVMPERKTERLVCYEACGAALGLKEPGRLDTCSIHHVVEFLDNAA